MSETLNFEELLEAVLQESKRFEQIVTVELCNLSIDTPKKRLSFLLMTAAVGHYRAVVHLLDDGEHRHSAYALVRPIADAAIRAVWAAQFASDEEIAFATSNVKSNPFPSPKKIISLIKQKFGQPADMLTSAFEEDWRDLCGHVHTGLVQLNSRSVNNSTRSFPHDEALGLLLKASTYLWLGGCYVATGSPNVEAARRIDTANDKLFMAAGAPSTANLPRYPWVN